MIEMSVIGKIAGKAAIGKCRRRISSCERDSRTRYNAEVRVRLGF